MSDQHAEVRVRFAPATESLSDQDGFRLRMFTDANRGPCALVARLEHPGIFRDAWLTMAQVLTTDLRRRPRNRADYLAYLLAQGKRATQEVWNAQREFLLAHYGPGPLRESPLDPVLRIDPEGTSLEVFSADQSAYARLWLRAGAAYQAESLEPGTSYIRLDAPALAALGQLRSHRTSTLELRPTALDDGQEQQLFVPFPWIRALGQVQSASILPRQSFEIAPIDLYNVMLAVKQRKARHGPRALRYELVPNERPRLVLEPWEHVIESTGPLYRGPVPSVVRTWGRDRLSVLSRLLPHARGIEIHLVGPGLPAYYVIDVGDAHLTLALSGWTDASWAGFSAFDQLDAGDVNEILAQKVLGLLKSGPHSFEALAEKAGRNATELHAAVRYQIQRGVVVCDVADRLLIHRPLLETPLNPQALRFRDERQADAHRLLQIEGAVTLTRVHDLGIDGVTIEGEVNDPHTHRRYHTSFTIDREGRTTDASCTSPQFRRSGVREGPTVPMLALRLLYTRQRADLERARQTEDGRHLIRAETRTLIRRGSTGSLTYRVSLDHRQVTVRWGPHPSSMRMQRLLFSTPQEARREYFGRLQTLSVKGFIDTSTAEGN